MSEPVVAASPDMTVADAGRLLLAHKIGGLPVVDGGRLVGMITETDILKDAIRRAY